MLPYFCSGLSCSQKTAQDVYHTSNSSLNDLQVHCVYPGHCLNTLLVGVVVAIAFIADGVDVRVKYAIKSNHAQNFMNIHDIKSSWIINEDFRLAIAHWKSTWQAHTHTQTNKQTHNIHTHTHPQRERERKIESTCTSFHGAKLFNYEFWQCLPAKGAK